MKIRFTSLFPQLLISSCLALLFASYVHAEKINPKEYQNYVDTDMNSFTHAVSEKVNARNIKKVLAGSHTYGDYRANNGAHYYDYCCFDNDLTDPGRWLGWPANGNYEFVANNVTPSSDVLPNATVITTPRKAWVVYNFERATHVNAVRVTTDPLLKGTSNAGSAITDYQLRAKSPCRNAGLLLDWMTEDAHDVTIAINNNNSAPRIFHYSPDIGAFETPFLPPTHVIIK